MSARTVTIKGAGHVHIPDESDKLAQNKEVISRSPADILEWNQVEVGDRALLPAGDPVPFPKLPRLKYCAAINTRLYFPVTNQTTIEKRVLVPMPNDDNDSSSSSVEGNDRMEIHELPQRAYWLGRTLRDATYGCVRQAVILRPHPHNNSQVATQKGGEEELEADWEFTGEYCVVKEMSWEKIRNLNHSEDPIKEVQAMQFIQFFANDKSNNSNDGSQHVLMPLEICSDDDYLYIITPFCNGRELFDRLGKQPNNRFSEEDARRWLKQILKGVGYLHGLGICHRDLSLENLMIHGGNCLVIDLGMCLRLSFEETEDEDSDPNSQFTTRRRRFMNPQGSCGKPYYISPEVLHNKIPFDGFQIDLWAVGVTLFWMVAGIPPWEIVGDADERYFYITRGYLANIVTGWGLGLSADVVDLLQKMLYADRRLRLNLRQVWEHPWLDADELERANAPLGTLRAAVTRT